MADKRDEKRHLCVLTEEKAEQRSGTYKRGDLLKMHAYRDAIRRSAGAYVIYPGADEKGFRGFHELLPGLGAFPLRPGCSDDGSAVLKAFLGKVTEHVCNRATQHEQQTCWREEDCPAKHGPYLIWI